MTTAPDITVVIPHLNQPEALRACLRSIQAGRLQPRDIIVVDNGSAASPADVVREMAGARLLVERQPGPGPARNAGIRAADSPALAFIDADCLADPSWLAAAAEALADPDMAILGGDVRIAIDDPANPTALEAYESEYAYRMDRYIAREGFTGTGNLVVRREVFDRVGLFQGLDVAEDRDWGQRATTCGYRIHYVPAMRVYHPARADLSGIYAKWDRHVAHDYVRARSSVRGRLSFAAKTLAMPLSPLAEIPRLLGSQRVAGLRAKVRAFSALARVRWHRTQRMLWLLGGGRPDALAGAWNRDPLSSQRSTDASRS